MYLSDLNVLWSFCLVPSLSQAKMTQVRTAAKKSQGAINGTGGNPQGQQEQKPNQEQPAKC